VSSLTLSVIATAASTQPNTSILSIVIDLGPMGSMKATDGTLPGESTGCSDQGDRRAFRIAPTKSKWSQRFDGLGRREAAGISAFAQGSLLLGWR
jgi:hypothetical protein